MTIYIYFGDPKDYDKDNDYDFIIAYHGNESSMYKPESLQDDDIIYVINNARRPRKCTKKDFLKDDVLAKFQKLMDYFKTYNKEIVCDGFTGHVLSCDTSNKTFTTTGVLACTYKWEEKVECFLDYEVLKAPHERFTFYTTSHGRVNVRLSHQYIKETLTLEAQSLDKEKREEWITTQEKYFLTKNVHDKI